MMSAAQSLRGDGGHLTCVQLHCESVWSLEDRRGRVVYALADLVLQYMASMAHRRDHLKV